MSPQTEVELHFKSLCRGEIKNFIWFFKNNFVFPDKIIKSLDYKIVQLSNSIWVFYATCIKSFANRQQLTIEILCY